MARESKFNEKFRREMYARGMKVVRIESHSTPGVPDNHFIIRGTGITGWIEIKEENKAPSRVNYRPAQVPWLLEYAQDGGNCWTILHVLGEGYVVVVPGSESRAAAIELGAAKTLSVSLDWDTPWDDLFAIFRSVGRSQPRK
jgi:hypothetical protein